MAYWRITTIDSDEPGVNAAEVQNRRLEDCFYGINEDTNNARILQPGDQLIFYVGGKQGGYFSANATLKTGLVRLTREERRRLCYSLAFQVTHGAYLNSVIKWPMTNRMPLSKALEEIPGFAKYQSSPGNAVIGTIRSIKKEAWQKFIMLSSIK